MYITILGFKTWKMHARHQASAVLRIRIRLDQFKKLAKNHRKNIK